MIEFTKEQLGYIKVTMLKLSEEFKEENSENPKVLAAFEENFIGYEIIKKIHEYVNKK